MNFVHSTQFHLVKNSLPINIYLLKMPQEGTQCLQAPITPQLLGCGNYVHDSGQPRKINMVSLWGF